MRRRTRPKVVWLPLTNANALGEGFVVYNIDTVIANGASGEVAVGSVSEIPIVADAQQGINDVDASIADVTGSAYRLRRIVGKIWVQCDQPAQDTPQSVIVTAGFIIRKADSNSGASLASFASGLDDIHPGDQDNTGDPWIWRRSWTLGNNNATSLLAPQSFPTVNWGKEYAGGIAEGPHVDQKTARSVGPEERLYLDVAATVLGEGSDPAETVAVTVAYWTDIRVLGSVRTSSGNRNNASR